MGEVYRARDTRLNRTVAIKIIKGQFGERFEREAQAISALNHPHICTLYDVGSMDGMSYLVMECVEGKPLKGPLPLAQALSVAVEIADALAESHAKGIVHRDLKPANILMTKTGVKLLDFGLAGFAQTEIRAPEVTLTTPLTGQGQILGTLHYMSPEQLEAKKADARSDIFSFGLVLYEILTGRRAFEGSSQASLIAAILKEEPPSLTSLQPLTPPALERTIKKCLAKDPGRRWQTVADLRDELAWLAEGGAAAIAGHAPIRGRWRQGAAWIAAAVFLGVCVFLAVSNRSAQFTGDLVRFPVYPPEKTVFSGPLNATVYAPQFALSPSGRAIVFAASAAGAVPMLFLRALEDVSARPLSGTEDAEVPFWSPDSRWVGFFAKGKLKKVPVSGGPAQVVAEGSLDVRGGSWGPDNTILFATGNSSIKRVSSAGGESIPVTRLDTGRQEGSHRWPQFLPGGRHFLYNVRSGLASQRGIYAGSLDGNTKKFLVRSDCAFYAAGYLLYLDGDTLLGQAFDVERLELSGPLFTVAQPVGSSTTGYVAASASSTGMLAHATAMLELGRLLWFDRLGNLVKDRKSVV